MKNPTILYRYKWVFILIPLLITVAMLFPLRRAHINPDLDAYLPEHIPAKRDLARMEAIFGQYEPIVLFLETEDVLAAPTLERLQNLSRELNRMPEFQQVMSLFDTKNIRGEEGAMIVEPAVAAIPAGPAERERLRAELQGNDLAYGLVVAEDFRFALLLANLAEGVSDDQAVALLEALLEQYPGEEKTYFTGTPYLKHEIQALAIRDLAILLPLGLLVMILFLYLSFREKRGVVLPLAVVLMSIILSMGLLPLMGWELSILAILVPIMMIAVANNYGVHLIARYQELNALRPDWDLKQITSQALAHLSKPILLTALTTIVGVLGLAAHLLLPARQMGVAAALGIAFALLLSLTFLPALLSGMKKGAVQASYVAARPRRVDRLLAWFGALAVRKPRQVVYVFAGALLLLGLGIVRLEVSIRHEDMMPRAHQLRHATQIADDYFGGAKNLSLLWEGDLKDPALLRRMDAVEQQLEQLPEVSRALSLATLLRKMSQALNDPTDAGYDQIPATRDAVAQYLELYAMSGEPEDLEQLVDFDYTQGAMNVQFKAADLRSFRQVLDKIDQIVQREPQCILAAGHSLMEKELAEAIVRGQAYSLLFAGLAIVILMAIIFRAIGAGLLGSLPLGFALLGNFGLMGWLGFDLDIANSLLSSIAIGIGVDYTIHLFWRLKAELQDGLSYAEAIPKTLRTTGRGIAINAFSVMLGFAMLFFSGLVLLKTFAFLILFTLLLCLLCALVLIPALCMIFRPRFLGQAPQPKEEKMLSLKNTPL
jgi:predicted RND superfamily exporter protein